MRKIELVPTPYCFAIFRNGALSSPGYLLFVRDGTLMAQAFDTGKLETTGDAVPVAEQIHTQVAAAVNGFFSASQNRLLTYAKTLRSSSQDSGSGWSRFSFPVGLFHPLQHAGLIPAPLQAGLRSIYPVG